MNGNKTMSRTKAEAEEMGQGFRTYTALAEDPSWCPTPTVDGSQLAVTSTSRDEDWKHAFGWALGEFKIIFAK